MFELQPRLESAALVLRPLTREDAEALRDAAADPMIWEQHPDPTRAEPAGFRAYFERIFATGGALAVIDRVSGRLIGSSTFYDYDAAQSEILIGYTFLIREFWGGSANRELKRMMIEHAFRFVPSVVFHVESENLRSRRAVEKLGARLESELAPELVHGRARVWLLYRLSR